MSYKKKKLKKNRLGQLTYKIGLMKRALLVKVQVLLQKLKSLQPQDEEKEAPVLNLPKVLEILGRYDRMLSNPDTPNIRQAIVNQLGQEGKLRLCVFVCPKFNPKALVSSEPGNYMPVDVATFGLFEDRIAKIISLKNDLMQVGLPSEVNLILGDNDAEEYIFPFIDSLGLDAVKYRQRQSDYRLAFEEKCRTLFGNNATAVWSLAEFGVIMDDNMPKISPESLKKELTFFNWLFSKEGPYRGELSFSEVVLAEMVTRKYRLYGAQGKFLEMLGGVLLQTEGPGVWLERTQMLRCTGARAIPAIYPWIRREERKGNM